MSVTSRAGLRGCRSVPKMNGERTHGPEVRFSMSYSIALARFTRIAGATALLLVPASAAHAQSSPNPNHPQAEADYLWWQLPAGEERYARIDGYRIKEDVQEIVAIARRSRDDGNQYWGVIAGQPYHDQVREWIGSQF